MSDQLKSIKGEPIVHLQETDFVGITENPFGHGCCDCGLWHRVEYCLVDQEGNEVPLPEGTRLAMRWARDQEQTDHFRSGSAELVKMSKAAFDLAKELREGVAEVEVAATRFGEVAIQDLDRDSLLRIITLLAVGKRKEEPSRIIRL